MTEAANDNHCVQRYEFVDADEFGIGRCIRRSGASEAGQLIDTPSLCGKQMLGQRYTRDDAPDPDQTYPRHKVATKNGSVWTFCPDCLRIWRVETGQEPETGTVNTREAAMDDLRDQLGSVRRDCDRYAARVLELDQRAEATRLISRGEWGELKELVDEYCAKTAEAGR